MKRIICSFALVCSLVFSAATAQAETYALWDVNVSATLQNIVYASGATESGGVSSIEWAGNGFYLNKVVNKQVATDMSATDFRMGARSNSILHYYATLGSIEEYSLLDRPRRSELALSLNLNPTGQSNANVNVEFTISLIVSDTLETLYDSAENIDVPYRNLSIFTSAPVTPQTFVYEGIVYEVVLGSRDDLYSYLLGYYTEGDSTLSSLAHLTTYNLSGGGMQYIDVIINSRGPASAVPIPGAVFLLGPGLAGLGYLRKRMS